MEIEIMKRQFQTRFDTKRQIFYDLMQNIDNSVWRCDPSQYIEGVTYEQLSGILQAFIDHENNLSSIRTCSDDCNHFQNTKSYHCDWSPCDKDIKGKCNGRVKRCIRANGTTEICLSVRITFKTLLEENYFYFCFFT